MEDILRYQVISTGGAQQFEMEVNKAIQGGWHPFGGVSTMVVVTDFTTGQQQQVFSQAMVKYKP